MAVLVSVQMARFIMSDLIPRRPVKALAMMVRLVAVLDFWTPLLLRVLQSIVVWSSIIGETYH